MFVLFSLSFLSSAVFLILDSLIFYLLLRVSLFSIRGSVVFHAFSLKATQYNCALNNSFTSKFVVTVGRDPFLVLHHDDAHAKKQKTVLEGAVKLRTTPSQVFLSVCMWYLKLQRTELSQPLTQRVLIFSRPCSVFLGGVFYVDSCLNLPWLSGRSPQMAQHENKTSGVDIELMWISLSVQAEEEEETGDVEGTMESESRKWLSV